MVEGLEVISLEISKMSYISSGGSKTGNECVLVYVYVRLVSLYSCAHLLINSLGLPDPF